MHDSHCEKKHGLPCKCQARATRPLITWLTWLHPEMALPKDGIAVLIAVIEQGGEESIIPAYREENRWFDVQDKTITVPVIRWTIPEFPH